MSTRSGKDLVNTKQMKFSAGSEMNASMWQTVLRL